MLTVSSSLNVQPYGRENGICALQMGKLSLKGGHDYVSE